MCRHHSLSSLLALTFSGSKPHRPDKKTEAQLVGGMNGRKASSSCPTGPASCLPRSLSSTQERTGEELFPSLHLRDSFKEESRVFAPFLAWTQKQEAYQCLMKPGPTSSSKALVLISTFQFIQGVNTQNKKGKSHHLEMSGLLPGLGPRKS